MISLKHVYKTYDSDRHALRDISFSLNPAELVFLTGSSGAGKTTLFKILSGQEKITSGKCTFEKYFINDFNIKMLSAYRQKIGIIFQDFRLISHLTIYDNIAVPLKIQNFSKKEISLAVNSVLEKFNLTEYAQSYPDYISGGEKQRVAIARSVIHKPQFIVADEPTGNLDKKNAVAVMSFFQDLALQGVTIIVATHDDEYLKKNSNLKNIRHIHLEKGQVIKDTEL